jgi:rubrerythrin
MGKLMSKVRAAVRKSPIRKLKAKATERVTKKVTKKATKKDGALAKPAVPPPESARVDFAKLTLKDALDLAILIEKEAEERYGKLSTMVGGRYAGDASDVFRAMVKNEARHCAQLEERRQALFGKAKRTVSRDALYDVEAPDFTKVNVFMSAREAMDVAVESEVKAHDFYDKAAANVKDKAVRKLFQDLRGEESQHEAMLRKKMKGLPTGPDIDPEFADEPGSDAG